MSLTSATVPSAIPQGMINTSTPADNRPRYMGSLLDGAALGSSKYSISYCLVVIQRLLGLSGPLCPAHDYVCSTSVRATALKAFDTWHRAFHGTKEECVEHILKTGNLLVPGNSFPLCINFM